MGEYEAAYRTTASSSSLSGVCIDFTQFQAHVIMPRLVPRIAMAVKVALCVLFSWNDGEVILET